MCSHESIYTVRLRPRRHESIYTFAPAAARGPRPTGEKRFVVRLKRRSGGDCILGIGGVKTPPYGVGCVLFVTAPYIVPGFCVRTNRYTRSRVRPRRHESIYTVLHHITTHRVAVFAGVDIHGRGSGPRPAIASRVYKKFLHLFTTARKCVII